MGRTRRKRKQKRERNYVTCDNEKDLVLLNSWLSKQGILRNKKLVLAVFDDTGRGVLTKKKVKAGEELINLPLNSTINVISILTDIPFCSIFLKNDRKCLQIYQQSITFQCMLAFYLTYLKYVGADTKWHLYLNSLPKKYTVPYFLPKNIQLEVEKDIFTIITKQNDIISNSFNIFDNILRSCVANDYLINNFKKYFEKEVYEWAYFTVNTRCVYMDLTNLIDFNNTDDSILLLINDNTKISLCPYLDMINHSPNAKNETTLTVSKNLCNVSLTNIDQSIFTDVWFSIYTKNVFEDFTQVFICYGDSHNLKLITEYGFFLPRNDLDYVPFEFDNVVEFLSGNGRKLSQEQMSFINNHSLNKDLYIDSRGLSFNLYGLLMVVRYYYDHDVNVSRLIYSAAVCSNDDDLNHLIKPMVELKIETTKKSISKLMCFNRCIILNNCIGLMEQYVCILEKFIKC